MSITKVAVYGTLRKRNGNHRCMERAGGVLLSTERLDGFIMHGKTSGFPSCVRAPEGHQITVEVYEVEDFKPLDSLEGYIEGREDNFYDREVVETSVGKAYIYTRNVGQIEMLNGALDGSGLILSGDWHGED